MELAMVYATYLDGYRSLRANSEDFADFILYKTWPWVRNSDAVLAASVTNRHVWSLLSDEFSLRSKMETATQNLPRSFEEKRAYLQQLEPGWWKSPDFKFLLAKTAAQARGLQLAFLRDEELKHLILEDYEEARRSLSAKNYKATILLCGSVAEAALTSAIADRNIQGLEREKLLKDFNLSKLIDAGRTHGLLTDQTLFQLLEPLRQYRNIIHPGVQLRKSITADQPRAQIAFETVNLLFRELNRPPRN